MGIGAPSMIISQSRVQQSAGVAVVKITMDTGKEATTQSCDDLYHLFF